MRTDNYRQTKFRSTHVKALVEEGRAAVYYLQDGRFFVRQTLGRMNGLWIARSAS